MWKDTHIRVCSCGSQPLRWPGVSHLLVFRPLPWCIMDGLKPVKNCGSVTVKVGHKAHHSFCVGLLLWWKPKLVSWKHPSTLREAPVERHWGFLPPASTNLPGMKMDPPAPFQPADACSSSRHLSCYLLRGQNYPAKSLPSFWFKETLRY